jgi:hypothetical protein
MFLDKGITILIRVKKVTKSCSWIQVQVLGHQVVFLGTGITVLTRVKQVTKQCSWIQLCITELYK